MMCAPKPRIEADGSQVGDSSTNPPTVLPPEVSSTVVPKGNLILFATTPGRFSYRDGEAGSWLPAEMKKAIEKKKKDETVNLLEFFSDVSKRVAARVTRSFGTQQSNAVAFTGCIEGAKCVPSLEHRITRETDIEYTVKQ